MQRRRFLACMALALTSTALPVWAEVQKVTFAVSGMT